MRADRRPMFRGRVPQGPSHNAVALAKTSQHQAPLSKRARGERRNERLPFAPPETWHEPLDSPPASYRLIVEDPGPGFRHVLTPAEVRQRLAELPQEFVRPLHVLQLSRMTRKKQSFPCYGMQWGSSIYLYPIEEGLVEYYDKPPKPSQQIEARMYGGRWEQEGRAWRLVWTERAIKDFYLNNILIHELGHLLDDRNGGYVDRERFAEWFAIHHGYRATRQQRPRKPVRRRHAAKVQ